MDLKTFFKKKTVIAAITIIVIVFIIAANQKDKPAEFSSVKVKKIDLIQSVEETGEVNASTNLEYGFEISGRVKKILKKVGDTVVKGETIAELDNSIQLSSLRQAQAGLAREQADLNLELVGVSDQEKVKSLASIEKAEATLDQAMAQKKQTGITNEKKIKNAERDLETAQNELRLVSEVGTSQLVSDAYDDLLNTLESAIPTLNNALRESDSVLGIDNSTANDSFKIILGKIGNGNEISNAEDSYVVAKNLTQSAEDAVDDITNVSNLDTIDLAVLVVQSALSSMRSHLSDTRRLLNATSSGGALSQATLNTMKSDIITEQSNISTKQTAVTNDVQAVANSKTSLSNKQIAFTKAKDDLDNTKRQADVDTQIEQANVNIKLAALKEARATHDKLISPPRDVDVAAMRAEVQKQIAAVNSAQKDYEKTILKAITDGVLAKLDIDIGENVTAGGAVATLISLERNIKVDISESDIAKVAIQDIADITLDAFGDGEHFAGHVLSIEPAKTEVSGVIYYKTTVLFDDVNQTRIRPGMTANVTIITETRPGVLVVPQRAIIRNGNLTVRVLTDNKKVTFDERKVELGLRGDGGLVEVISGLTEGEEIITFIKEKE